jgi:protoporphyrin/coproporphyrin ferrochelatase
MSDTLHSRTAVLLVNTGTPDSYSRADVKKYLDEFLSDPRVLDINPIGRRLLLDFIILPFRSSKSAALYKHIWTPEGSPLLSIGKKLAQGLQQELGERFIVRLAMRYQSPSIEDTINEFNRPGIGKIVILPLFPQYASASVGSVHQKVMEIVSRWQVVPDITFISSYYNDPGFIRAWTERSGEYDLHEYDHYLFSYHGLPERQIRKADPTGSHCLNEGCCEAIGDQNLFCYRAQCFETTRRIAATLGLERSSYTVSFQSRLGRDPWIKPYTDTEIVNLAREGKKKLLVFAPAFVTDCLETIHEIGTEYDELFKRHGGEKVQLVESLNTHPAWISALKSILSGKA